MSENGVLLSLRRVTKAFRRPRLFGLSSASTPAAVTGVDLEVRRGEVVGLIGESGSGKTTLARVALGLISLDAGEVQLFGRSTSGLSKADWLSVRRRAQLLIQSPSGSLNPGLTVREHLNESVAIHQPKTSDPSAAVRDAAAAVGLELRLDAKPTQLSGGEQRRVGIARVMIAKPEILVADEPTTGLDAALKADLIDLLLADRGPDRGYLLISHDLALVRYACDRIVVLHAGGVVEEMPVDHIGRIEHHPYTRTLLEAGRMLPRKDKDSASTDAAEGRLTTGCSYAGACSLETAGCRSERPVLTPGDVPGHRRACRVLEAGGIS